MSGPVEWAALVFFCSLMASALGIAWRARGILADIQIQIAVKFNDFEKDIRHTKRNVEQHAVIGKELNDDMVGLKKDVARLDKLVNGKH